MRRALLALAACALGLSLTAGAASAGGYGGGDTGYYHGRPGGWYRGVAFGGGYYYPGRDHYHWDHRVWDSRRGRYHYYDPYYRCYYYWHPGHHRYYPVSYCP
jgi:hypothetical protein